MTRVCLLGDTDVNLTYELLSRETARDALATYEIEEPFENSVAVDTVSLGAAVSLLNDLNWYLTRYADSALVQDPSVSETEWLSRNLAERVRADEIAPAETAAFCRVHGVRDGGLLEPLYARRTRPDESLPAYDLADADGTVVVRVTQDEFESG